jgi:2-keto-4-pentenoate hydratase/2-oxohepta-3-ene-1,7-dioic acid hydratase in catechol pathway
MKLVLFDDHIPGLLTDGGVVDLSAVVGPAVMGRAGVERMPALIEAFDGLRAAIAAAAANPARPLGEARLRAPLPRPQKMLFAQGNYFENTPSAVMPLSMFLKAPSTITDPGGLVTLSPQDAIIFHHEAELGLVIGKGGKDIPLAQAMDHIFGYTCIVDVSARGLGRGLDFIDKSPDTFCPMGPCIVTRDEIADPQKLAVRLSVNGQPRQDYNTDDMEHPVGELVAWASEVLTLKVGDIIACGTNHKGLGPLQDGDVARMTIEGVGELSFRVEDPQRRRWPDGIDAGLSGAVIKMRTTGEIPSPQETFTTKRIA